MRVGVTGVTDPAWIWPFGVREPVPAWGGDWIKSHRFSLTTSLQRADQELAESP